MECPVCKNEILTARIPTKINPSFGVIGESPSENDVECRTAFSNEAVLRNELGRLEVDCNSIVLTTLWPHPEQENEECFSWGVAQAIRAVKKCRVVLLLGSETTQVFVGKNVSDVSGLKLRVDKLPEKIVLCAYNPEAVKHGTLGEWRLTMERLRKELQKHGSN